MPENEKSREEIFEEIFDKYWIYRIKHFFAMDYHEQRDFISELIEHVVK